MFKRRSDSNIIGYLVAYYDLFNEECFDEDHYSVRDAVKIMSILEHADDTSNFCTAKVFALFSDGSSAELKLIKE